MKVLVGVPPATQPQKSSFKTISSSSETIPIEDLEWEKLSIDELLAMATTMSLMGDVRVFRLVGALNGNRADEFLTIAPDIVASLHQFILVEEKLLKKATDSVTKAGAEIKVYAAPKKIEAFNMFSITFAFALRDRKKLWLQLHESLGQGVVPEAFAGMLAWKVRDMLSKNEKGKYTKVELHRMSSELVTLYHESHRGVGELSLMLERYILLI